MVALESPAEPPHLGPAGIPPVAWAVIVATVPLHVLLALATDLSPDEAYYLCAARLRGDLVDHPPLATWLLRLSDHPWAPVELRVRIWAIGFALATAIAAVALARRRGAGHEGCIVAALLSAWALLPTAGGFVMTPDGPALLAVVVALLNVDHDRTPRRTWVAALALFLGALAKVIVLPIALLLAVALAPAERHRRALWRRVALATAPLLALPLLLPSLHFQLRHAFVPSSAWSPLQCAGALLGAAAAQLLLWSPPVMLSGLRRLGGLPATDRAVVLGLTVLTLLSAVVRGIPPEPNWWAPAALLVVISFAVTTTRQCAPRRMLLVLLLVVLPTVVAAAHTLRPFLPLSSRADPTARLHGWSTPAGSPLEAPGIGPYGVAAEQCVYRGNCSEIESYFNKMRLNR